MAKSFLAEAAVIGVLLAGTIIMLAQIGPSFARIITGG